MDRQWIEWLPLPCCSLWLVISNSPQLNLSSNCTIRKSTHRGVKSITRCLIMCFLSEDNWEIKRTEWNSRLFTASVFMFHTYLSFANVHPQHAILDCSHNQLNPSWELKSRLTVFLALWAGVDYLSNSVTERVSLRSVDCCWIKHNIWDITVHIVYNAFYDGSV